MRGMSSNWVALLMALAFVALFIAIGLLWKSRFGATHCLGISEATVPDKPPTHRKHRFWACPECGRTVTCPIPSSYVPHTICHCQHHSDGTGYVIQMVELVLSK